jgi:hypothetical protein
MYPATLPDSVATTAMSFAASNDAEGRPALAEAEAEAAARSAAAAGSMAPAAHPPTSAAAPFRIARRSEFWVMERLWFMLSLQINHEEKQWLDLRYGIMAAGDKNTMMRIAPFRR